MTQILVGRRPALPAVAAARPPATIGGAVWLLMLLAGYVGGLQYAYQAKIAPAFGYLNLIYREPDWFTYTLAFALVAVVGLVMPRQLRQPSDFILWVMFVMVVVPSVTVPQYADILPVGKSLELAAVVTAAFLLVVWGARSGPQLNLRIISAHKLDIWVLLVIASVFTYVYLALTVGLSLRLVGLADVWQLRSAFRDQVAANGPLIAYLVRFQGYVINPLFMVRGLHTRRWTLFAVGAFAQVPIYGGTGYKMVILSIPAVLLVALLTRRRARPNGRAIVVGGVAVIVAALVADWLLGGLLYTEVFVNRLLLTPGILTAAHVMVFTGIPKAYWADGFMGPFVTNPHGDESPSFMVGRIMFGDPRTSANANLFGDGYSNLGYTGIFIEALVLVLILWVIDGAGRHLPMKASIGILLVPTIALANTSVFTSVLSNGFACAIVVMAFLPATGWARERRPDPEPSAVEGRHRMLS